MCGRSKKQQRFLGVGVHVHAPREHTPVESQLNELAIDYDAVPVRGISCVVLVSFPSALLLAKIPSYKTESK